MGGPKARNSMGFLGRSVAKETQIFREEEAFEKEGTFNTEAVPSVFCPAGCGWVVLQNTMRHCQREPGKKHRGCSIFSCSLALVAGLWAQMRISTMMRSLDDNVGSIAALSAALGASMFCDDVLSQPQHLFPEKLVYLHRCLQVATSPKPATQSLPLRAGMGVDVAFLQVLAP